MTQMQKEDILIDLEDTARLGLKAIRAFLSYQGGNPDYYQKARVGAVPVSGYTRLRATMANEESNRLNALKLEGRKEK